MGNFLIKTNETFNKMLKKLKDRRVVKNILSRDVPATVYYNQLVGTIDLIYKLNQDYFDRLGYGAYYIKLKEKISELYKKHPEFGYIYYSEIPDSDGVRKVYLLSNGKKDFIGNDNWKCTAGIVRVTIDSNGKVYCCPFIKDSYLGNLNNENLSEIWNNVNRFKFLKRLSEENTDRVCLAIKQGNKGGKE